ncbi:hypothetical protein OT109_18725 [Phycisphaeraceae bacterium D3-23]
MTNRFKTRVLLAAALLVPAGLARGQITQIQADWVSATDGDWNDPANWSSVDYPDNAGFNFYDVLFDAAGSPYTATLNNLNVDVDSLTLDSTDATLRLSGGAILDANTIDLRNGTLEITFGTIEDATITATGGVIQNPDQIAYFEDVTLASDLQIMGRSLYITNAITLANDAVIDLSRAAGASFSNLTFEGTDPRIFGSGTLRFHDNFTMWVDTGNRGFIEPDVTLLGQGGTLYFGSTNPNTESGRWVNRGTIRLMGNGADLFISDGADSFRNTGLIEGFNDATLHLQSQWDNTGTIRLHDTATLNLGGTFELSDMGTIEALDNAAVLLSGHLTMQPGEVFEVDGSIPRLDVHNGRFIGGRVRGVGGNTFNEVLNIVFDNTTLESIDILIENNARIYNGLVLDNADLIAGDNTANETFQFYNGQTISGTGRLVAGADTEFEFAGGGHTVFGSGITLDATAGFLVIGDSNMSWENQGTILVGPNRAVSLAGVWTNNGTVHVDGGTILLDDDFTTADIGTIIATGDATVRLADGSEWDNTGQITDLATLFPGMRINLEKGIVTGGTLTASQPIELLPMRLRDVTLDFDWDPGIYARETTIRRGLTITAGHTITLHHGNDLRWINEGPFTLNGEGTIESIPNGGAVELGGEGMVIASGITIRSGTAAGAGGNLELDFQTNHGTLIQRATTFRMIFEDTDAVNLGTIRALSGSVESTGLDNQGLAEAVGVGALLDFVNTGNTGTLRAADGGVAELNGLTNDGQVLGEDGGVIRLGPGWTNPTGTISVSNGGVLELLGWSATPGTVTIDQSTVRLAFSTDLALLNTLPVGAGSTVEVTGTLDLTGGTLDLDALAPEFLLIEGTLRNGSVIGTPPLNIINAQPLSISTLDNLTVETDVDLGNSGTTQLRNNTAFVGSTILGNGSLNIVSGHTASLDAAAIEGNVFVDAGATMIVSNGLALDGTIASGVGVGNRPQVRFEGTQSVTGTGAFVAGTAQGLNLRFTGDLTLGEDIQLGAQQGILSLNGLGQTLTLHGVLDVGASRTAIANVGTFVNHGSIILGNNATFQLNADTFVNHTTLDPRAASFVAPGTEVVNAPGSVVIADGTIDLGNDATFSVAGQLQGIATATSRLLILGDLALQDTTQTSLHFIDGRSEALAFLHATGDASIDGELTLDAESLTAAVPGLTQTLVFASGEFSGVFTEVTGLQIDATHRWHLDYQADRLVAEVRLAGDVTGDGFVGVEDLDVILANWGSQVVAGDSAAGEWTGDGVVGQADLDITLAGWGDGVQPEPNVPEPGSAMLVAGMLSLLTTRRRRRSSN